MTKRRQSGVALVTVMVVVAAAVVLGVQMTTEQTLAISRAGNFIRYQQALEYAIGGEELARQILAEDQRNSPGKDHLAQAWANPDLQYEFEQGTISMQIVDLSSKLNINSLRAGDAVARARFENLARELGIDPMFVHRLVDWVDEDDAKSDLGAEDFDYLGLQRPYRTSGRPIPDVSELRLLLEMENASFERMVPYIAAIPDPDTVINVNTAPAIVLKAVAPDVSLEMIEGLAVQRDQQEGYSDIASFLKDPVLANAGISEAGLGVQSGFFEVNVVATYEDRLAYLTSIIQRDQDGSMRVIYRDMSKKISPVLVDTQEYND